MKRACYIAAWALGAYAATWLVADFTTPLVHELLAASKPPGWFVEVVKLATEFSHYMLPYIAGAVVFAVALGGHLPGTRLKH